METLNHFSAADEIKKQYRDQLAFKGFKLPKSLEDARRLLKITEEYRDVNFRKNVDWRLLRELKNKGLTNEKDLDLVFIHRK